MPFLKKLWSCLDVQVHLASQQRDGGGPKSPRWRHIHFNHKAHTSNKEFDFCVNGPVISLPIVSLWIHLASQNNYRNIRTQIIRGETQQHIQSCDFTLGITTFLVVFWPFFLNIWKTITKKSTAETFRPKSTHQQYKGVYFCSAVDTKNSFWVHANVACTQSGH